MKPFLTLSTVMFVVLAGVAFANETTVAVEGYVTTTGGRLVMNRIAVSYGDLNLAAKPDAVALLERLKKAAATVCTSQTERHALAPSEPKKYCQTDAVHRAVNRVGSPELSALANE